MFWRFNNMCTTNIDSLLNDEDITLQRLMDEDDIIQECKSSNRKLINFLSKTDVLHDMISLVTKEPSAITPDAVRFKYNNIAAELFSCDVSTINDAIIVDENLLNELCQFVYEEQPLNPLMASFFSKTMAVLFNRKSEKMIEYLKAKEGFLSQLLKHLKTSAIMDLILKLITCVENRNTRVEISEWLCSEKFVENLLGLLSGKADLELHGNVAQLLCDLLRVLRDMHSQNIVPEPYGELSQHSDYESDPILQLLESKPMIELLLDRILLENVSESSIVHGITVLLTLLEIRRPPQLLLSEPETVDRTPANPVTTQCIRNTVEAILPRLKNFHEILKEPPQKNLSETFISRICNNPLGFVRLHIARLIATLIATGSSEVRKELAALGTLSLLMDMMLEYSHNNFLHSQIERSIQHILGLEPKDLIQTTPAEAEAKSEAVGSTCPLLVNLFTEIGLLQRIMEAWKVNEAEQTGNGATRKAYMGHLIKIANYVVEFGKDSKNASKISNLIQSLPESVQSEWQDFVEVKLFLANKNNEIIPVSSNMVAPRSSSDEEDSDSIRIPVPRDTVAQEVFSDYQMEAVSKHMITQFGFADDLSKKDQIKSLTDALTGISSSAIENKSSADCTNAESSFDAEKTQNPLKQDPLDLLRDSSSDEDDDNCDRMDIDNVNPWADSSSLKMSSDTVDPWGNATIDETHNPWASTQDGQDENWANFSNAEFINVPAATSPMEITEPSEIVSEETSKTERSSEEKSPEMSDIQSDLAEQTVGPV